MTNKRLYEIMDQLGMVDESDVKFPENVNLISTMNFVDDLTTWNDLETIKKLLVAIIMENNDLNGISVKGISDSSTYHDNCQADMGNKITLDIGNLNKPIPTKDILTKDGDK